MKYLILFTILILGVWSCNEASKQEDSKSLKEESFNNEDKTETNDLADKKDSIQYEMNLNQEVYSFDEPIFVTLVAKNISKKELRIWIDAGDYPTGTELKLLDSLGESLVRQHWSVMSSQVYNSKEVEQFKTTIPPQGEFKKEYNLLSILQLKKDLSTGAYKLTYNNSELVKFEIK